MLKLSEAIRLGAMALPEAHGPSIAYDYGGKPCGACAIGAALYAAGLTHHTWVDPEAIRALPLMDAQAPNPVLGHSDPVSRTIIYLFEEKFWTREEIADWVESIEVQQAAGAVDPVEGIAELTPVHARI